MKAPSFRSPRLFATVALAVACLGLPGAASANKLSWLDDIVQQVVQDARAGGRLAARGGDGASAHAAGRLFVREADEGLELLAKRSDDLARVGRKVERPTEAALHSRFLRLTRHDPDALRTFASLAPAEKRLVVEMGETAQRLARRYPGRAEPMIRSLGVEGLSAVRTFGDDVAEVIVKEGPESISVLRKTGRGGWSFFTHQVLPHKKKLAAAGVLTLFLLNPEKFVDYAGRATDYATRQFARAGIELAGAVGQGASRGLEATISRTLAAHGLDATPLRYAGMGLAGLAAIGSLLVILGLPVRWLLRPIVWPARILLGRRRIARA